MTSTTSDKWSTMSRTVFLTFGFVLATLIIYEHRIHVLGLLPYLFLSTCILMHLFMHHGQGGNHGHWRAGQGHDAETNRGPDHA